MIKVSHDSIQIKGTNADIFAETCTLIEELLTNFPEIPVAIFAGNTDKFTSAIDKCNPEVLKMLVTVLGKVNKDERSN